MISGATGSSCCEYSAPEEYTGRPRKALLCKWKLKKKIGKYLLASMLSFEALYDIVAQFRPSLAQLLKWI